MKNLNELNLILELKKDNLIKLKNELDYMEHDPLAYFDHQITALFDDHLNECYGSIVNSLPFYCGSAARLCEKSDPCFYRTDRNNFADRFDVSIFEDYKNLESEIEDLESEIEDLESEIEDLESGEF